MTKEERKAYHREYMRAYRDAKGQEAKDYERSLRDARKDGFYTLYYLPEEHYVGCTNRLKLRMSEHRRKKNRHVLDVEVIATFSSKREALDAEKIAHSLGYRGSCHKKSKK